MAELALDDYLLWLPDMEETTVAGQRALEGLSQLIVELPGGAFTLTVSGWLDTGDENVTLSDEEMLQLVAELALPNLIVPEATLQVEQEIDLEELQAFLDDPTTLELEEAPMPPRPMCEYIDLDAVNGLGILEYDTLNSFFDEICSISQADFSKGYSDDLGLRGRLRHR